MNNALWTVDAHCHWSDPRLFGQAERLLPQVVEKGVVAFHLGGVDPEDWSRQDELVRRFPGRFWRSYGLHPYFVAKSPRPDLASAWLGLQARAAQAEALGETGLDFRRQYLSGGKPVQIEFFQRQLALAVQLDKPVVLHIVRAHEEALLELRQHDIRGMVHAFTASATIAKRYLDLGLYLSVGARLLAAESAELGRTIGQIPLTSLLLESDCPDQAPPGLSTHDSLSVWLVAKRIAELKKLPLTQVVEQTRANLFTLLKKEEIQP